MSNTHFGFETVDEREKARRVRGVFDSVAPRYDLMNDLMSMGLHRAWKAYTVPVANVQPGHQVLDIAGGTGDLARAFARKVGADRPGGAHRHQRGHAAPRPRPAARRRRGAAHAALRRREAAVRRTASFDLRQRGLRPAQHDAQGRALAEMSRVLKPGGKLLVLEFSKVAQPLEKAYDWYSFKVLPRLGQLVAGDADSYRYLAESIRMHPGQAGLKAMMKTAGFGHVDFHNLTGGVVALHVGIRC